MNKQIKELAQQAGMYVDLNGNPWPKAMSAEECEAAYKKFAELIVRECADLFPLTGRPLSGGTIQSMIKEHFGVEE